MRRGREGEEEEGEKKRKKEMDKRHDEARYSTVNRVKILIRSNQFC